MFRVADLFCGAGGAAMGLHQALEEAGVPHEITGVDIVVQKHYPFNFVQRDALEYELEGYDCIWASPVCKGYTSLRSIRQDYVYPKQIPALRERLMNSAAPYVIENVPGAPLLKPVMLCGQQFGLQVYRHRLFEASFLLPTLWHDAHNGVLRRKLTDYQTLETASVITVAGHNFRRGDGARAMGIDWMTRDELSQAIPPAYSRWIMQQWLILSSPKVSNEAKIETGV